MEWFCKIFSTSCKAVKNPPRLLDKRKVKEINATFGLAQNCFLVGRLLDSMVESYHFKNRPMNVGISVIIPVVDEAAFIGRAIEQFTSHPFKDNIELIVVDGGSIDETKKIANEAGAFVMESARRCRAAQMNLGASRARHSILYFVHADVLVPKSFYEDILFSLGKGHSCGCYRSDFGRYPGLMRLNAFMTRFNILTFRGGDQTLFITRAAFQKLNGFDEYYTIMEDYDLIDRIWKEKLPFDLIQKDVIISVRKYENNSWLRVQLANGVAMFFFKQGKNPEEIKKAYRKLLNYKRENYLPT
jgi:rSAM/selenodomain-associated transferase 2